MKSNQTDNDSVAMKSSHRVIQGYTGVAAVDAQSQVGAHASALGTDQENTLLPEVVGKVYTHFDAIGKPDPTLSAMVLAESGDHSKVSLQQLHESEVNALVADTGFRARDPRFAKAYRHKPPEKHHEPGERRSKWFSRRTSTMTPRTRPASARTESV